MQWCVRSLMQAIALQKSIGNLSSPIYFKVPFMKELLVQALVSISCTYKLFFPCLLMVCLIWYVWVVDIFSHLSTVLLKKLSPQNDEPDLNESQKTRLKTATASKFIPQGFRITFWEELRPGYLIATLEYVHYYCRPKLLLFFFRLRCPWQEWFLLFW